MFLRSAALVAALLICGPRAAPAGDPDPQPAAIRVAAINAATGIAAPTARHTIAGLRCAVGEVNRRGGVLNRPIALLEFDNRSTPIGAKVAADKAVAAGVCAILGSAWSSHTMAVARVAQAAGVPLISNISTAPGVTRIGDFIFRVCFNDLFQGRVLAELARRDLALSRAVMFVNISSDYSMGLAAEFQRNFESLGGKVLAQMHYKPDQADFKASLDQTAAHDPDTLFIPGYDESGVIIAAAEARGIRAIPLGGDGWGTDSFQERGGRSPREGYFCTHWSAEVDTPASRDFIAAYGRFDPQGTPYSETALAYDSVMLLADAIARAGSLAPLRIREALAATRRFPGVTGDISFGDPHGDPQKGAVIMKIENGRASYWKTFLPR
jgi:branched-chain amino acid transport system substrate-binding protein